MKKEYGKLYSVHGIFNASKQPIDYLRKFYNTLTVYVEHEHDTVEEGVLHGTWTTPPYWDVRGTDCHASAEECLEVVQKHFVRGCGEVIPVFVYHEHDFTRTTEEINVTRVQYTCTKEFEINGDGVQVDDVVYMYTLPEQEYPISLLYVDYINGTGAREPKIILNPDLTWFDNECWRREPVQCMPIEHIAETQYDYGSGEWLQIRNSYWDPEIRDYFYDRMLISEMEEDF